MKDKIALVTGSSRGIGAAIAKLFAREGAKVALHGRDAGALYTVLAEIGRAGGQAGHVTGDTTKFSDIEAMRRQIEREFGSIDILVANAGGSITKPGPIEADKRGGVAGIYRRQSHRDVSDDQEFSTRHEGAENWKHHHHFLSRRPQAASRVPNPVRGRQGWHRNS